MDKHNTNTAKIEVYTQAVVGHHQELSQRATNSECPQVVPLLCFNLLVCFSRILNAVSHGNFQRGAFYIFRDRQAIRL